MKKFKTLVESPQPSKNQRAQKSKANEGTSKHFWQFWKRKSHPVVKFRRSISVGLIPNQEIEQNLLLVTNTSTASIHNETNEPSSESTKTEQKQILPNESLLDSEKQSSTKSPADNVIPRSDCHQANRFAACKLSDEINNVYINKEKLNSKDKLNEEIKNKKIIESRSIKKSEERPASPLQGKSTSTPHQQKNLNEKFNSEIVASKLTATHVALHRQIYSEARGLSPKLNRQSLPELRTSTVTIKQTSPKLVYSWRLQKGAGSGLIHGENLLGIRDATPICSSTDSETLPLISGRRQYYHDYQIVGANWNDRYDSDNYSPPPSPAPELSRRQESYQPSRFQINESCFASKDSDNLVFDHVSNSPLNENDYQRPIVVNILGISPSKKFKQELMGRMERHPIEDHERKIIIEFCHLLEKSKQLFNGLRELPQYGHKQWHSYFGRTFDVYTKLWKFQQQHRAVLDSKYGLKRWQIGEIASKIGQLYYHFYLRTSETAYLNEAFCFYYAIRARCYYTKACKEDKCELMVKKLRYYARFIVVCLLLKKNKLVRELIKELDRQIIEYGNTYDPDDQIEWNVVVDEVKAFIQAESVVSVLHSDNYPALLTYRLTSESTPPLVERSQQMNLALQEVLIVGSSSQQVKFSELTMDMFRMLQTLEREPSGEAPQMYDDSPRQRFISTPNAPTSKGYLENGTRTGKENPHKYLLFKPSPSQVLVYLASGCNDLPPGGALLLYISAEGQIVQSSKHPEDVGFDVGGLITTSKIDVHRDSNKDPKVGPPPSKIKETQCLHPGDLHPFTRRPFFIIIDSDNSYVFQHIPRHFGQPLVVLMSPLEIPSPFHDRRLQGNLFTLFLHSPLTAVCYLCDIHSMQLSHWERGQFLVDKFMCEASALITSRSRIDPNYIAFMGDDFLRLLLVRFIFCEVTLRLHRAFRARTHLPRSSPPLPEEMFEHPLLMQLIMDLAAHLQVRGHFNDPTSAPGPPPHRE